MNDNDWYDQMGEAEKQLKRQQQETIRELEETIEKNKENNEA